MNIQRHPPVRLADWLLAAFFCLSAGTASAARPLPPVEGEVIVGFKPQGDTMRKHALAARAARAEVQTVLGQRAAALGARVNRTLQAGRAVGPHMQVIRAAGADAVQLARQLAADPDVAFAVPNGRKRLVAAPNDPLYAEAALRVRPNGPAAGQWYLRAPTASVVSSINIEAAWTRTLGRPNIVVAVLDTGVRFDHPDLGRVANQGVLLPGYDFVGNGQVANDNQNQGVITTRINGMVSVDWDDDPSDPGDWVSADDLASSTFNECGQSSSSWHGTSTASLIGALANNGLGIAGASPGVRVLPVRVLGKCFGEDADIWAGMLWAGGIAVPGVPENLNPARVINMSLGGAGFCNDGYRSVVSQLVSRKVVVVAAAGNGAGGAVGEPANCPGAIAVVALRHAGSKVGFSDIGPEAAIAAPGGNCINTARGSECLYPIVAATNSGDFGPVDSTWSDSYGRITVGTSFSTPLVSAVAALMLSQQPLLDPEQVKLALQVSARTFPTTGANNGADSLSVRRCDEPDRYPASLFRPGHPDYARDSQCYCTTALCGAGMLDAGAAVAAVSGPLARVEVSTASPTAGQPVLFTAAGSLSTAGAALTRYEWLLADGGGIVRTFDSATNAVTAELTPTAAGSFTVRLTVTDASGATASASTTVAVAATPAVVPPVFPPPANTGGGGGGGGATSLWWVLGVLLAVALLHTSRPAERRARGAAPQ